jgi:hypothetical protein
VRFRIGGLDTSYCRRRASCGSLCNLRMVQGIVPTGSQDPQKLVWSLTQVNLHNQELRVCHCTK